MYAARKIGHEINPARFPADIEMNRSRCRAIRFLTVREKRENNKQPHTPDRQFDP
jgi:hypothetical protein